MGFFDSVRPPKLKIAKKVETQTPSGVWRKCVSCSEIVQNSKIEANCFICPYCNYHYRCSAQYWTEILAPEGFEPFTCDFYSNNPLQFYDRVGYEQKLQEASERFQRPNGILLGKATLDSHPFILAIMDFKFMGGSMGVAEGESLAMAFDLGLEHKLPVVIVSSSGGARMQEGILSLMQLAKTSAARSRLRKKRIPFISILTDPTTGGVAASFSFQGDIILAEPNALIGFAGPRVIEQSIRQTLPSGFQRSEFLLSHGMIDRIVDRREISKELSFFLSFFSL